MANSERRKFLKTAGAATVGIGAAGAAMAQTQPRAQPQTMAINRSAKAVLPGGKMADRGQILQQLGLDPTTPPDAWLSITSCGSNASALSPAELKGLVQRGTLKQNELDAHSLQKLRSQ
jgi:hypothetical protein